MSKSLETDDQFPSPVKWLKCKRVHSRDDSSRIINSVNDKQIAVLGETIEEVLFFLATSAVLCKSNESEVRQISSFVLAKVRRNFAKNFRTNTSELSLNDTKSLGDLAKFRINVRGS